MFYWSWFQVIYEFLKFPIVLVLKTAKNKWKLLLLHITISFYENSFHNFKFLYFNCKQFHEYKYAATSIYYSLPPAAAIYVGHYCGFSSCYQWQLHFGPLFVGLYFRVFIAQSHFGCHPKKSKKKIGSKKIYFTKHQNRNIVSSLGKQQFLYVVRAGTWLKIHKFAGKYTSGFSFLFFFEQLSLSILFLFSI